MSDGRLLDRALDRRSSDQSGVLFGSTMELVALTTGFFALGAYIGRDMSAGWGLLFYLLSFGFLIAMRFAVRSESASTTGLLVAFGTAIGLATGPTVAYYANTDPAAVWEAGGATALFMAALGLIGYSTKRDLTPLARIGFWALLALIVYGVVMIFVQVPGGELIYCVLGLAIFALLTVVDFQRLRTAGRVSSAPLLAASIFLDALNVFLFFLQIFSRRRN